MRTHFAPRPVGLDPSCFTACLLWPAQKPKSPRPPPHHACSHKAWYLPQFGTITYDARLSKSFQGALWVWGSSSAKSTYSSNSFSECFLHLPPPIGSQLSPEASGMQTAFTPTVSAEGRLDDLLGSTGALGPFVVCCTSEAQFL